MARLCIKVALEAVLENMSFSTIYIANIKCIVHLKFPNCLCGINTRQLELLLWRAGPTAQHMQDCPIFFYKAELNTQ